MTSRLVIGTPRIPAKPPMRRPCTEALVYDSNILRDPSFDILPAGTGPGGDELPVTTSGGGLRWPSEASGTPIFTAPESTGWCNEAGTDAQWKISTANPRTGTHHARQVLTSGTSRRLRSVKFCTCLEWSTTRVPVSGRVEAGAAVTFSVYAMADATTGTPRMRLRLHFVMQTSGLFSTGASPYDLAAQNLTTSYAQLSHTVVAPAASFYFYASLYVTNSFGRTIDVDDTVLEVA